MDLPSFTKRTFYFLQLNLKILRRINWITKILKSTVLSISRFFFTKDNLNRFFLNLKGSKRLTTVSLNRRKELYNNDITTIEFFNVKESYRCDIGSSEEGCSWRRFLFFNKKNHFFFSFRQIFTFCKICVCYEAFTLIWIKYYFYVKSVN